MVLRDEGAHRCGLGVGSDPRVGDDGGERARTWTHAHLVLHGGESEVRGDAGYQGVHKRPEHQGREVDWQVAMRPGRRRRLDKASAEEAAEKRKASIRAKVEHPVPVCEAPLRLFQGALPGLGEKHANASRCCLASPIFSSLAAMRPPDMGLVSVETAAGVENAPQTPVFCVESAPIPGSHRKRRGR